MDIAIRAALVALTVVYTAYPVYSYFSTSLCREVAGLLEAGGVGFDDIRQIVQGLMSDEDRITDIEAKLSAYVRVRERYLNVIPYAVSGWLT